MQRHCLRCPPGRYSISIEMLRTFHRRTPVEKDFLGSKRRRDSRHSVLIMLMWTTPMHCSNSSSTNSVVNLFVKYLCSNIPEVREISMIELPECEKCEQTVTSLTLPILSPNSSSNSGKAYLPLSCSRRHQLTM